MAAAAPRYVWIFAFQAVNGSVPNLPEGRSLGDSEIDRVPPRPPPRRSGIQPGLPAQLGLRAVRVKDADVDDLLLLSTKAYTRNEANAYIREGLGKLLYDRSINAVLYALPTPLASTQKRESGKSARRGKRPSKTTRPTQGAHRTRRS